MYEIGTQVRYHGSHTELHGAIFIVAAHCCGGTRYRLAGPERLYHAGHGSITPVTDRDVQLADAIQAQQPVMITYTDAVGQWTTRTIEPYEIATTRDGHLIVRAMDRMRGEPRSFRLDRIRELDAMTGGVFLLLRPEAPEAAGLARILAEIAEVEDTDSDAAHWSPDVYA